MSRNKDNFIMSPKIDFVFKLLFGDEKNKDLLISFLSAVLKVPENELIDIKIINSELLREFKEDKKGILDVRAETKEGKQIDIEIQILPTEYMPERTLFYWSKMYTSKINPGDTYDKLKKCITINILDFKCMPIKKLHTTYHITEDETRHKLTDILEIHFLELPKLFDNKVPKNENDPIVQWMQFIDGKSRGVMEMLANKNKDIKKAYDILEIISQDEKARMAYEAREAEIRDQLTRIKSATMKGRKEGIQEGIREGIKEGRQEGIREGSIKVAKKLLKKGLSIEEVAEITELELEKVEELKKSMLN